MIGLMLLSLHGCGDVLRNALAGDPPKTATAVTQEGQDEINGTIVRLLHGPPLQPERIGGQLPGIMLTGTVDFPETMAGNEATATVQLIHPWSTPGKLHLMLEGGDFRMSVRDSQGPNTEDLDPKTVELNPGDVKVLTVTFRPTDRPTYTAVAGTLRIVDARITYLPHVRLDLNGFVQPKPSEQPQPTVGTQ